ncbi:MAG: UDP-N-acetylmuramoyl-L-alanyl-D-glutamate--2,6-diaminopimelate ligase [Magnetococcales bacterium]|nr:UDP-N-acetylmuramoyl-L-alanyl-D-glutamate--2,6-diaminopimelate ligase [Magnetococcales bacterium]
MKLSEILGKPVESDLDFKGLKEDSRLVETGDVFVYDQRIVDGGEKFVNMAREKGAVAIVTNLDIEGEDVHFLENPFDASCRYAKSVYPNQPPCVVGVTGTNGKTSTAWFYNAIVTGAGEKAASIGTLGVYVGDTLLLETGYTSPTPLVLHQHLHELAEKGVQYCCMEISSHALAMHRADGVLLKAGAFTNITPDHRDFHGSMEAYMAAKQRLFTECLPEGAGAIVNIQKPELWPIAAVSKQRNLKLVTVGSANAELVVQVQEMMPEGMKVLIKYESYRIETVLPLVGSFQAENIATAIGLCLQSGLSWGQVEQGLKSIQSVPGRMEVITAKGQPVVVVDYAHTPDALKTAIEAVRPQVQGRLWTVFGCGGDRDKTKRPEMGKIANDLSDFVVVTDDNPRTENAGSIRKDILKMCPNALECGDRAKAIELAVSKASKDDTILLAGKGHESGQYVMGEVIKFDDRDQARKILGK